MTLSTLSHVEVTNGPLFLSLQPRGHYGISVAVFPSSTFCLFLSPLPLASRFLTHVSQNQLQLQETHPRWQTHLQLTCLANPSHGVSSSICGPGHQKPFYYTFDTHQVFWADPWIAYVSDIAPNTSDTQSCSSQSRFDAAFEKYDEDQSLYPVLSLKNLQRVQSARVKNSNDAIVSS